MASQAEYTQDSINTRPSSNKQVRKSGNIIRPQQTREPAGKGGVQGYQPGKLKTDPDLQPKANGNIRRHSAGSLRTTRGHGRKGRLPGHLRSRGRTLA